MALFVLILYFVIQQIVGTLLVPIVMKRSVGISPLVTILALLIGVRLGGIGGAVLAVPMVIVIQVVISSYLGTS
jgi:predicted PurR-regulated permease PerM